MKIEVNWNYCDGNGACAAEAPDVFELDDQGDLHVLMAEVRPDLLPMVEAAVTACPKHALSIA